MPTAPVTRFLSCGDAALAVEFGDSVDRRLSGLVLALAERLKAASIAGVVEAVPTYRSLLVYYDPMVLTQAQLKQELEPLISGLEPAERAGRVWRLPACYHESCGPDLAEVAERTGLTVAQVVERHSAVTYHVYMLGFLPGLPYMGDLDPKLVLPRRENPRVKVPPGSIAIATTQTCVYALESPGGWHLLGRTPVSLWDLRRRQSPSLLAAGDKVIFQPVSLQEYERLLALDAAGELRLTPDVPHGQEVAA